MVAFGATIGGFKISNNAIHSVVKTSVDNTTQGIYMDNDGQLAVGDADNFIKYYKDADGEYRLELSVGSLMVSHKNVEETLDGIQNTVNVLDETTNNRFDETTTLINEVNENSQEYTRSIVQDYAKITDLEETRESLSAEISTSATGIKTEVANTYMTITKEEEIYATIKSLIEQSEAGITMKFEKEIGVVENDILLNQLNYKRYIRFGENGIELGDENAPTTFRTNITNTEIYFSQGGEKIAYISNSTLYINNAHVLKKFTIGREETGYYDTLVRVDKHWTLKYRTGGVS